MIGKLGSTKRRSKWLFRALIAIGFFVLAGELFARFGLGLGTPPLTVVHPTIEYMFLPNQDIRRFDNRILINEYGMRSGSFPKAKQEDEYRVIVFGDSIINGGSLTDHAKLATTDFEKYLEERLRRPATVGNVSAGSWGPGNWLAYVKHFGTFDADAIFLVISSHDYADNPEFKPLNELTQPTELPSSALWEGIERYLPRYLPRISSGTEKSESLTIAEVYDHRGAIQGLGDLREFLNIARASAKRVVVFQHSSKEEVESGELRQGNLDIRQLCRELEIPVISLGPYFAEAIRNGQNPYRDDLHPNDLGQTLLFRAFAEAIENASSSNESPGL